MPLHRLWIGSCACARCAMEIMTISIDLSSFVEWRSYELAAELASYKA